MRRDGELDAAAAACVSGETHGWLPRTERGRRGQCQPCPLTHPLPLTPALSGTALPIHTYSGDSHMMSHDVT